MRMTREQCAATRDRLKLPYPVLADEDELVHRQFGAIDAQGHDSAAVYVTDRHGEVFGVYRAAAGQPVPTISEIMNRLQFINAQCPECEPPEWPL